jgi:RHS repeat-associated protein
MEVHTSRFPSRPRPERASVSDGEAEHVRYDSQGNLKTTETSGRPDTRITVAYDLHGRKTQVIDPDMGAWSYQYNGYGELVSQTDALNQTVALKYDRLGRLVERNEAEGQSLWVYGTASTYTSSNRNIGKLVSVSGPDGLSTKTTDYDSLGRPSQTATHIDIAPYTSQSYATGQTYDAAGRIRTVLYPEVGGGRFQVKNHYNPLGYLSKVTSFDGGLVYWRAQELNARGQLELALLGNGASVMNTYRPETGLLDGILVDANDLIYHMSYEIDEVGNIESRTDQRQSLTEAFQYDILDRITSSSISGGTGSYIPKSYSYDTLGNITSKTGVGNYSYGACGAGPHAVCQAGNATYTYNANGSMTSGGGRTVSYTSFNLPYQFEQGGNSVIFHYGADRTRIFKSTGSNYTAYIGMSGTGNALYEHEVQGTTEKHLHFIYAGGQALAVHTIQTGSNPQTRTEYLHRDHLGSVEAISNSAGLAVAYFSHDAWGKPRNADWTDSTGTLNGAPGNLGFTGHEMIPEVGLVHMNGRVYDPMLGKFLSADPTVQFEKDVRSYNRYSYVSNNPLRYTDPTGYSLSRLGKWLRKHVMTILNVVSWFYSPLQPFVQALNIVSIGYYASNAQQMAGGLLAMYLGGKAGDKAAAALGEGAKEFTKAIIRGGTTGAVTGGANSMLMGAKISRGILQGMAVGAATAAIAWKVSQSPAGEVRGGSAGSDLPEKAAAIINQKTVTRMNEVKGVSDTIVKIIKSAEMQNVADAYNEALDSIRSMDEAQLAAIAPEAGAIAKISLESGRDLAQIAFERTIKPQLQELIAMEGFKVGTEVYMDVASGGLKPTWELFFNAADVTYQWISPDPPSGYLPLIENINKTIQGQR